MSFINLNLHRAGAINATAYGCFSGNKAQEIIVARGNSIELLRVDNSDMPKLVSIAVQPAFCVVRSLAAFRLTGSTKDYCAVGSDSGKITILEYAKEISKDIDQIAATWNQNSILQRVRLLSRPLLKRTLKRRNCHRCHDY
eukprot:1669-Heterococcus_DN1.PRE.3